MGHLPRDPHWLPVSRYHAQRVPLRVRAWLLDEASLTGHLRAYCPGHFQLRVLREFWALPRADETRVLGMPPGHRGRVREVALCCGNEPLVCARTVIPERSLRGRQQRLAGVGRRPLGALLFADRSMEREPFEIARITLAQAGLEVAPQPSRAVWARRAIFRVGGTPLLVAEFFLPALFEPGAGPFTPHHVTPECLS